jgi:hypothetical protein
MMRTSAIALVLVIGCVTLTGCGLFVGGGRGDLAARSEAQAGAVLQGRFTHAVYSFDTKDNLTILLSDGPIDTATQIMTVRMFWQPRAAHTPLDPTATNVSIQYVVFTPPGIAPAPGSAPESAPASIGGIDAPKAQVGVYSGAGFLWPDSKPGKSSFKARIRQANLRLSDRSAAFADLLGKARLEGSFAAARDDEAVLAGLRQLHARLTAHLGYPRLVDATPFISGE